LLSRESVLQGRTQFRLRVKESVEGGERKFPVTSNKRARKVLAICRGGCQSTFAGVGSETFAFEEHLGGGGFPSTNAKRGVLTSMGLETPPPTKPDDRKVCRKPPTPQCPASREEIGHVNQEEKRTAIAMLVGQFETRGGGAGFLRRQVWVEKNLGHHPPGEPGPCTILVNVSPVTIIGEA